MPKKKMKKASISLSTKMYAAKRKKQLTDNEIAVGVGLTRRRVSMTLNQHLVNPNDIILIKTFLKC